MFHELNKDLFDKSLRKSSSRSPNPNQSKQAAFFSPPKEKQGEYFMRKSPNKLKYVPSRYGVREVMQSTNNFSKNTLLNDLQQKIELVEDEMSKMSPEKMNNRLKEIKSYHPLRKSPIVSEYKSKPIRKSENDFLKYKNIFVAPKQKILYDLREKEKAFTDLIHLGSQKQYNKIIGVDQDESKNIKASANKLKRESINFSAPNLNNNGIFTSTFQSNGSSFRRTRGSSEEKNIWNIYNSHNRLQTTINNEEDLIELTVHEGKKIILKERVFFEQQIQVIY